MFAIKKTCETMDRLRAEHEEPDRKLNFVGHQANLRMLESACRQAGVSTERHHHNVEWYGNTGAASAASVLSQRWEKWSAEDDVEMVGVGGGLSWSGYLVRFVPDP